jgi:hypothetical protein
MTMPFVNLRLDTGDLFYRFGRPSVLKSSSNQDCAGGFFRAKASISSCVSRRFFSGTTGRTHHISMANDPTVAVTVLTVFTEVICVWVYRG